MLVAAAATALVWVNVDAASYESVWATSAALRVGGWSLDLDLRHWVNEALMTVFFLVVGLEIKRELVDGELSDRKAAALPVIAAIGGMVVPAIVYTLINSDGNGRSGWAIPMATDIAMALGVLALLGTRVPPAIKLFLLALAIVDDIGSVVVIAIFYGDGIRWAWMAAAVCCLGLILVAKLLSSHQLVLYTALGITLWHAMYRAGIHPTLAGVVCGLLAPTKPMRSVDMIDADELVDVSTVDAARLTVRIAKESVSVVEWLEHKLVPWSSYVIVPLFALANAGIRLSGVSLVDSLRSRVALGVIAGLVVGKAVGITAFSWIAVRLGVAQLPVGVGWQHIAGAGALGGIGFTVSLFIADLAFESEVLKDQARLGIFAATVMAAVLGAVTFYALPDRRNLDIAEHADRC